ncbi:MAG: nucleotide exchange factor GrpE [Cyclobacteriaceae bacterium]
MAHKETEENKQHTEDTLEKDQQAQQQKEADKGTKSTENPDDKADVDNSSAIEEELATARDKYLRLYAEFENYRRRTSRERADLIKTANEELILNLLSVVDDLDRSLDIFKDKDEVAPMYEGIQLVNQKFHKVLNQKGLKPMEVDKGADFDPEYHEAVAQIPAPEDKLKGKIVDVVEKGYFLGEKVLRYAKVVIGQ